MNKQEFRETLLEFLRDVTNVPELPNFNDLTKAPNGFKVLNPFTIIKDRSEELNEKYWLSVRFFTNDHWYQISACLKKNGGSYLGAGGDTRKPRPSETWTRGNDLPDGKFNRATWNKIKNAIIRYELQRLSKYVTSGRYAEPENQVDGPSIE